ncbi:MAG: hypothetical protein V4719_01405 [Planctomycetota bacterium]
MKFFTMEWWSGCQRLEFYDPMPDFQSHLDTIRDRLPPDLLALQETVSLHDANLCELDLDVGAGALEIQLNGDDGTGGLRRFTLQYSEVDSFRSIADRDIGLPGPHGYGDLGYNEADLTDTGMFEHRLLFSTGIELQIVFGNFSLEWEDC